MVSNPEKNNESVNQSRVVMECGNSVVRRLYVKNVQEGEEGPLSSTAVRLVKRG